MHNANSKNPAILRIILRVLLGITAIAVIASPAHAAGSLDQLDGGTLAAVIAFGTLLFAIVFDVWHTALRSSIPARKPTGRKRPARQRYE